MKKMCLRRNKPMSQPKFPIPPDITRDDALNMLLASIAMEELGLSHIINAEGEKLQYILGTLKCSDGMEPSIEQLLQVNNSITCLLDSVMQNQIFLKSKMEKVLNSIEYPNPGHTGATGPTGPQGPPGGATGATGPAGSPGPPGKSLINCSAMFSASCQRMRAEELICWQCEHAAGKCIRLKLNNNSKILLAAKKNFQVFFSGNICGSNCFNEYKSNFSIGIILNCCGYSREVFTYHMPDALNGKTPVTASFGGIIVSTCECCESAELTVVLKSPDSAIIKEAFFSIIEIL